MKNSFMEQKKLFLLDAFALIYRAYFAFSQNQRYNSKGLNTSAILGFTNTLLEVLQKEKPTHIAVVFDSAEETFRVQDYTAYKANRQEMPEDIRSAIPYIKELIKGFKIPILESPGYEADDIIGTLAVQAEKRGFKSYLMTPDKDFAQLVTENVFLYKPAKFGKPAEVWGIKEVCEKFEIKEPKQVIDILGLWGDAVDNIPGIPGIGEKTAKKLIAEFGSMEGLFENVDKLSGKIKENVISHKEQGRVSRALATIILDVPVEFKEEELILEEPDKEILRELFTELEFKTIAKRVLGEELSTTTNSASTSQMDLFGMPVAAPKTKKAEVEEKEEAPQRMIDLKTIETVEHNYQLVETSDEKLKDFCDLLNKQKEVCFDTETTGTDTISDELVGMSFCFKDKEAYYLPVPANKEEANRICKALFPFFTNENVVKVAQNMKFDLEILFNYKVEVKGKKFDTMIAHYLLQPDSKHGMDYLSETYLDYKPVSIETLIGAKGKNQKSMADVELENIKEYAAEDADITFQLKKVFEPKLKETDVLHLFEDIEMPLIDVLAAMEMEGIALDTDALKTYSAELEKDIIALEGSIKKHAGLEFNVDSPKQLGAVLFEHLRVMEGAKKTKTGQYATNEDVLSKLVDKHPIIREILEFRELRKLKSTYVDALPQLVNSRTKRIHTNYMQTVAATGRLSSNNPNLQNIPIKTAKGREIRKAFIPRDDKHLLLAADYSQIELRIIAALSGDENMIEAFKNGLDIHAATAARVFGVKLEEVDRDLRSKAKAVNFGIIYGQSAFGLSQNLNISRSEAKEIIDSYFKQYSKIKQYMEDNVAFAKANGYVETIMKRKRYLKDIDSSNAVVRGFAERNAINAPIQGSAADVIKVAMINLHCAMKEKGIRSKMLLQVHDELVFDALISELDVLTPLVKEKMENAVKLSVPLTVETNTGKNWLEAH